MMNTPSNEHHRDLAPSEPAAVRLPFTPAMVRTVAGMLEAENAFSHLLWYLAPAGIGILLVLSLNLVLNDPSVYHVIIFIALLIVLIVLTKYVIQKMKMLVRR